VIALDDAELSELAAACGRLPQGTGEASVAARSRLLDRGLWPNARVAPSLDAAGLHAAMAVVTAPLFELMLVRHRAPDQPSVAGFLVGPDAFCAADHAGGKTLLGPAWPITGLFSALSRELRGCRDDAFENLFVLEPHFQLCLLLWDRGLVDGFEAHEAVDTLELGDEGHALFESALEAGVLVAGDTGLCLSPAHRELMRRRGTCEVTELVARPLDADEPCTPWSLVLAGPRGSRLICDAVQTGEWRTLIFRPVRTAELAGLLSPLLGLD
jgi:hypothetical protein